MTLKQFQQVIDKASDYLMEEFAICGALARAGKNRNILAIDFLSAMNEGWDGYQGMFWFGKPVGSTFETKCERFMLLCCFEEWVIANKRYRGY